MAPVNFIGTQDTSAFRIMTRNKEQITVDSTGRVGINNRFPELGIHMVDNGSGNSDLFIEYNRNDGFVPTVVLGKSKGTPLQKLSMDSGKTIGQMTFVGYSQLNQSGGYVPGATISAVTRDTFAWPIFRADLQFAAFNRGPVGGNNPGQMAFTHQGYLGVGTYTPNVLIDARSKGTDDAPLLLLANKDESHRLFLFGGRENDPNPFIQVRSTDPLRFATDENGFRELMRINPDGNVGIGTNTPAARLEVITSMRVSDNFGSFNAHPYFTPFASTALVASMDGFENGPQMRLESTAPGFIDIGLNGTGDFVVEENDEARFTVALGGNVGIGTAAPSAKLHIAGQVRIADGTQGAGKVLTSDANGLASWQPGVDKAYFTNWVYGAPAFEIPSGVETTVNFSVVRWSQGLSLSGGTITAPSAGLYHIDLVATENFDYNNAKNIRIRTYLNGGAFDETFNNILSLDMKLNEGDQVVFKLLQDSGSTATLNAFSHISCHKVY